MARQLISNHVFLLFICIDLPSTSSARTRSKRTRGKKKNNTKNSKDIEKENSLPVAQSTMINDSRLIKSPPDSSEDSRNIKMLEITPESNGPATLVTRTQVIDNSSNSSGSSKDKRVIKQLEISDLSVPTPPEKDIQEHKERNENEIINGISPISSKDNSEVLKVQLVTNLSKSNSENKANSPASNEGKTPAFEKKTTIKVKEV